MLKKITSVPKKTKNHIVKHRATYATVATATVCAKLHFAHWCKFVDFLDEKNLLEEYYSQN